MNRIIGIDPGNQGAIVISDPDANTRVIIDMPTLKPKKKGGEIPDLELIIKFLDEKTTSDDLVVMETPQKRPTILGSNVQANYLAGYYTALFVVLFRLRGMKYRLVPPKRWQLHYGISSEGGDTGKQAYCVASKLYPTAELRGPRGGIKDGRCDAILIMDYAAMGFPGLKD